MKLLNFFRKGTASKESVPLEGRFPDDLVIDFFMKDWRLPRESIKLLHSDDTQRLMSIGMMRYIFGINPSEVFDQGLIPRLVPNETRLTKLEIDLTRLNISQRADLLVLHRVLSVDWYHDGVNGTCAKRLDAYWREYHV